MQQYLQRYAEPEARNLHNYRMAQRWRHVLVIPAYRESPALLAALPQTPATLLILVLNRPDSDPDTQCNNALREYLLALPQVQCLSQANGQLLGIPNGNHVLLVERPDPIPRKQGVGLARKIGCDAALALGAMGCVTSRWIHCSDADATLPVDYFDAAGLAGEAVALSYRFCHTPPTDAREREAINVYERYLQHYVDGLQRAGSPYAYHTLGSCIAVDAIAYATVRGFPRRAGGEDFYLLNKLAKHGPVVIPDCAPIRLSARRSSRVPFGTGPALIKLLDQTDPAQTAMFYDPRCFDALGELIRYMAREGRPGLRMRDLSAALAQAPQADAALRDLGIEEFLLHASRHCASPAAYCQQFHQWFDGFRTLKFIHALSEQWGRVSQDCLDTTRDGCRAGRQR